MTPYIERDGYFWYIGQSGEDGEHEKTFNEMLKRGAEVIEAESHKKVNKGVSQ